MQYIYMRWHMTDICSRLEAVLICLQQSIGSSAGLCMPADDVSLSMAGICQVQGALACTVRLSWSWVTLRRVP